MLILSLIGAVLIAITVAIHGVGTTMLVRHLSRRFLDESGEFRPGKALASLIDTGIVLVFLHVAEIAVYFSFVTFTTLGYGDITLSEGWRLLSGIQALNGILLVGWSTALIFAVVQRSWQSSGK